jgi:hypothetical protein
MTAPQRAAGSGFAVALMPRVKARIVKMVVNCNVAFGCVGGKWVVLCCWLIGILVLVFEVCAWKGGLELVCVADNCWAEMGIVLYTSVLI